jgi:hypothetical protein
METGALGWGFQDQIQPTLNDYDRQISDVRLNGVEGQLARMQVMNGNDSGRGATDMPSANDLNSISRGNQVGLGDNVATAPSLDDAAMSAPFNLRQNDLAAIRNGSDIQQGIQLGASTLAGPVVERLLPELGVAKVAADIVGKAIDAYDGVQELTGPSEKEKFEQAYQQALFNQLNGMMVQRSLGASTPPAARGLFP